MMMNKAKTINFYRLALKQLSNKTRSTALKENNKKQKKNRQPQMMNKISTNCHLLRSSRSLNRDW